MKLPVARFLALAATALTLTAQQPAHRLFSSVAMTKAQKNSSTATDSGLYYRNADGQWTLFGPRITIAALTARPDDASALFTSSSEGVVRSRDSGATWRKVTGWDIGDVRCLAFDPKNPSLAYGASAWGPIRSTDGGENWTATHEGLAKLYSQTIDADPRESGRVILGTEDGIYFSTNAAKTWRRADSSPHVTVLHLARSALEPAVLLAGTQGRGAWLSRDNGATWAACDSSTAGANLYATAIDSANAAHLALAGWGVGVRISDDGGKTWADRTAGLPVKNIFVLTFDPDTKGRLWASTFEEGTFYSDDLGRTWKDGGLYGAYGFDFAFVPLKP